MNTGKITHLQLGCTGGNVLLKPVLTNVGGLGTIIPFSGKQIGHVLLSRTEFHIQRVGVVSRQPMFRLLLIVAQTALSSVFLICVDALLAKLPVLTTGKILPLRIVSFSTLSAICCVVSPLSRPVVTTRLKSSNRLLVSLPLYVKNRIRGSFSMKMLFSSSCSV